LLCELFRGFLTKCYAIAAWAGFIHVVLNLWGKTGPTWGGTRGTSHPGPAGWKYVRQVFL